MMGKGLWIQESLSGQRVSAPVVSSQCYERDGFDPNLSIHRCIEKITSQTIEKGNYN